MPKQKISNEYNLKIKFPEICKEWHYEKNIPLEPKNFTPFSKKKTWWICKDCKYEWQSTISNRTGNNSGCPECSKKESKKKVIFNKIKKEGSFASQNPKILYEWHPTKNGDKNPENFTSKSKVKVWWLCSKCKEEWLTELRVRSGGSNCPKCSDAIGGEKLRLSLLNLNNNFKLKLPHIASEWHPKKNGDKKPENYSFSSNKIFWWKCVNGHVWKASLNNRGSKNSGCPKCTRQSSVAELRILSELEYFFDITHRYKFKGKEIDLFIKKLKIGFEYDGYYYHKSSLDKDIKKNKFFKKNKIEIIRIREAPLTLDNFKGVQGEAREITKKNMNELLDLVIPFVDLDTKNKIYDYKKKDTFINEKIFKTYLSYFPKPFPKKSLKFKFPKVSKMWNYKLNNPLKPENFSPGSDYYVWWKCDKGHEWEATIKNIVRQKTKCFRCYQESNTIIKKFPYLINDVNPKKNNGLDISLLQIGSRKQVWWICKFGHEWKTTVASRTLMKSNCAKCYYNGRSRNADGKFKRT